MRRTLFTTVVLSITLIFFCSFSAMAQEGQEKPGYITIKAGTYTPTGDLDDFHTDFYGEFAFGRYLNPNFALEAGIGYSKTEATESGVGHPLLGSWVADGEVTVIPITLTAKGVYPGETFELYGGAGIGVYFGDFEIDYTTTLAGNPTFDDDDTVFGVHILAGLNFDVSDDIFIGVEGKYIWTEEGDVSDISGGLAFEGEADLNGYMVTANIGFRF
jgi:opacity protein-like surface antigen